MNRLARAASGSANRVIKDVALAGSAFRSAVSGYRMLGPHEAWSLFTVALLTLAVAIVGFFWPRVVAYPAAVAATVTAVALVARAIKARP